MVSCHEQQPLDMFALKECLFLQPGDEVRASEVLLVSALNLSTAVIRETSGPKNGDFILGCRMDHVHDV